MRYFEAFIGSAVVAALVFVLIGVLVLPFLPELFRASVRIGPVFTNNIPGLVLGAVIGGVNFRLSLRYFQKREQKKGGRPFRLGRRSKRR